MDSDSSGDAPQPRPVSVARSTLLVMVVRAGSRAVSFVVLILLARSMGSDTFGDFVYVVNWLVILEMPGTLGLQHAALRFGAEYTTTRQWGKLQGYLRWSARTVATASVVVGLLLGAWIVLFGANLSTSLRASLWIAAVALPLTSVWQLALNMLRTQGKMVFPEVLNGSRPLFLGAAVLVFSATARDLTAPWGMAFHGLWIAAGLGLATWALSRALPRAVFTSSRVYDTRTWLRTAIPMFGTLALNGIIQRSDTAMVGAIRGTEQAGFYRGAVGIAELVVFGLAAVVTVVAPTLAGLSASNSQAALRRTVRRAARFALALTLPAVAAIVAFGHPVLGLFGEGFEDAYVPLLILAAGQVVNAFSGPVGELLNMAGQERIVTGTFAVWAAANIALNAALIPLFGLEGAAAATSASIIGWNASLVFFSIKRLDVNPTAIAPAR